MKLIKFHPQSFCHEYRRKGDLRTSLGFGDTPESARRNAVYGPHDEDNTARDHPLGFGDWELREDRDGDHHARKRGIALPD